MTESTYPLWFFWLPYFGLLIMLGMTMVTAISLAVRLERLKKLSTRKLRK